MKKNAFTIVEMAFVLVVIGIISAMAVKGMGLYEVAKVRKEITLLQKFKVAANSYISREAAPGNPGDSQIDPEIFAEGGVFTLRQLESNYGTGNWSFYYCADNESGYNIAEKQSARKICARHAEVETFFACHVEVVLDNENYATGHGRVRAGSGSVTEPNYRECDKTTPGLMIDYMYRIY